MKKVLALIFAVVMCMISSPALADTIQFQAGAFTDTPPYENVTEFTPTAYAYNANPTTPYIYVEIAGKTCKFRASYQSGYNTCNYLVTVTPNGENIVHDINFCGEDTVCD